MSIIQEALKKVETHKKTKRAKNFILPYAPRVASRSRHIQIIVFCALVSLICGIVAARFLITRILEKKTDTVETSPVLIQGPVSEPAPQPDVIDIKLEKLKPAEPVRNEARPSVVRKFEPEPILNGIMYLEAGARAIINNSIVAVGDVVNGAIVTVINKKSVVLKSNDTEETLKLQ